MNESSRGWRIERREGHAGDLHLLPDPDLPQRMVRVLDVDRPAIVLGSTQRVDVVDAVRAERAGIEVVRRRSGGGAVLLRPEEQLWIDMYIPAGDPLWCDDVGVASWWAGEVWATALERSGSGPTRIHRDGLVKNAWSGLICFAGLGPGEVTVADHKMVGISQRRSRAWTRIQTTAFKTWDPTVLIETLALTPDDRAGALAAVIDSVSVLPASRTEVVTSLLQGLPR